MLRQSCNVACCKTDEMLEEANRARATIGMGEVTRFNTRIFYNSGVCSILVEADLARKYSFEKKQSDQGYQIKGRMFWSGTGSVGKKPSVDNATHMSKQKLQFWIEQMLLPPQKNHKYQAYHMGSMLRTTRVTVIKFRFCSSQM